MKWLFSMTTWRKIDLFWRLSGFPLFQKNWIPIHCTTIKLRAIKKTFANLWLRGRVMHKSSQEPAYLSKIHRNVWGSKYRAEIVNCYFHKMLSYFMYFITNLSTLKRFLISIFNEVLIKPILPLKWCFVQNWSFNIVESLKYYYMFWVNKRCLKVYLCLYLFFRTILLCEQSLFSVILSCSSSQSFLTGPDFLD